VDEGWIKVPVAEVVPGDRIRHASGAELTVTRVEPGFLGRPGMVAFIEDTPQRWLKAPAPADGEIEVRRPS
jgi:hypothetical protein